MNTPDQLQFTYIPSENDIKNTKLEKTYFYLLTLFVLALPFYFGGTRAGDKGLLEYTDSSIFLPALALSLFIFLIMHLAAVKYFVIEEEKYIFTDQYLIIEKKNSKVKKYLWKNFRLLATT